MAGYEKVRSASPSGRPSLGLEHSSQASNLDDEEELLAGPSSWDAIEDGATIEGSEGQRRRFPWLGTGLAMILGCIVLGVMIYFGHQTFLANNRPIARPDFRRSPSDYVISPSWRAKEPPKVRHFKWTITDIVANPDGVFRPMLVINGQFPGPMIVCNEGDTIIVDVDNQAKNSTSLHWHGIFQNGTNWMDGAVGTTQCPIAPGGSFRYEFTIRDQAGTYFYHGHHGAQSLDGLVGPLIVIGRDDYTAQNFALASDRVVMVQAWYHDLSDGLLRETLSPGVEGAPQPNNALINGAGIVDCSRHKDRRCDASASTSPLISVQSGQQHRLRVINVGGFGWFEVNVDNHLDLAIVEVDAVDVEPVIESSILLAPGQRHSVILTASDTMADAFWLRARMMPHCYGENVHANTGSIEAKAIVRYDSVLRNPSMSLPTTENDSGRYSVTCKDAQVDTYKPIPARAAPECAHQSWYLRVNVEIGDWRLERSFLNQSSFRPNIGAPTLHRLVDGLTARNESFTTAGLNDVAFDPKHELVVSSNEIEVIDIILQNFDEGNHPFHLHGTQMYVLASGHAYFPGYEALGLLPDGKGLLDVSNRSIIENPLRRDVITVEPFGWTLIRFIADNPGVWLFHCHMVWHGDAGMAMQFASRLDVMKDWTIPEENLRLCNASAADMAKGATPDDSIWYGFSRDRRKWGI